MMSSTTNLSHMNFIEMLDCSLLNLKIMDEVSKFEIKFRAFQ